MTKENIMILEADRPTAIETIKNLHHLSASEVHKHNINIFAGVTETKCEALQNLGVEVFVIKNPEEFTFPKDVSKCLIVLSPERLEWGINYVQAALKADIPFILLQSVACADERQDKVGKIANDVEMELKRLSGKKICPEDAKVERLEELKKLHHHYHWSILRIGVYDETLLAFRDCIKKGVLDWPIGNAKFAPVAIEDVGKVEAHMLMKCENHYEQTYTITGSELLDGHQFASRLKTCLSHELRYEPKEDEDHLFREHLRKYWDNPTESNEVYHLLKLIKGKKMEYVTPNFVEIEGYEPKTPEQFFLQFREKLLG